MKLAEPRGGLGLCVNCCPTLDNLCDVHTKHHMLTEAMPAMSACNGYLSNKYTFIHHQLK